MHHLIVARHTEDVTWADALPNGWKPMIVEKGRDLPNEGREAASYLWAIQKLYRRLNPTDTLAFVQGNPFDHDPHLLAHLAEPTSGFRWLGDDTGTYQTQACGLPHHPGLPVGKLHLEWTGREFPGSVLFAAGGQFMLPGRLLLAHPRGFYERMRADVCVGEQAWVAERLWEAVLGGADGDEADVREPE